MSSDDTLVTEMKSRRTTLGILAVDETDEVPGTVVIFSNEHDATPSDELKVVNQEDDSRSINSRGSQTAQLSSAKRTSDGTLVLNPQPEDTPNDPLNWPIWRRNVALFCLGFYCMLGGGMTAILAAGFNDIAATFGVTYSSVALTTGMYMMGLGVGSVIFSPTACLFGKRSVYLLSPVLFVLSAVWCALAPSYTHLVVARVFQGIAVSPVECLPSATIAEIFFLHERAYRVGIYTLLLLGGKNLIPLVSAAIIEVKGWRWVFWVVAIVVGFCGILLFFFVPETIWDRTPRPRNVSRADASRVSLASRISASLRPVLSRAHSAPGPSQDTIKPNEFILMAGETSLKMHGATLNGERLPIPDHQHQRPATSHHQTHHNARQDVRDKWKNEVFTKFETDDTAGDVSRDRHEKDAGTRSSSTASTAKAGAVQQQTVHFEEQDPGIVYYTSKLRDAPPVSYLQTLKPWTGRISQANWLKVCARPFVLYAYPSVLWSSMVYALSVGWLIVLSQAVAHVYETRDTYNFSPLQVGLVYISPFIGGVLGTAVAGRLSDVVVRFMARHNNGIYEPEFRLVMAIPIAICTAIGLMGFGWSAQEKDNFMVPTVFFGIIGFGCCMGSTTAITYCVDSYRGYAMEALVTLNFSKNILHGLVWSLFFPRWLQSSGSKTVFLAIGGIQIACMLLTIPMYIYGKRARMWTVRMRMMERF